MVNLETAKRPGRFSTVSTVAHIALSLESPLWMLQQEEEAACVTTSVKMKRLSSKEIEAYVATGEPLGKAGAYAVQGKGAILIERVNGCYYNVVGLPLPKLADMLKNFHASLIQ